MGEADKPEEEEPLLLESWREPLLDKPPNWTEALLGRLGNQQVIKGSHGDCTSVYFKLPPARKTSKLN